MSCLFILGLLPGVCESFWPVSQLSDKPASVPQPKGLVAYRLMPWPPESLKERKGGGRSTLPKPGSAPPVPSAGRLGPPLLHTQPPKGSGQSTEGPSRGSQGPSVSPQALPSRSTGPGYGPELICKDKQILAVQGANQKMPVMGPPSWLDSPAWDRMVPLIHAGVSSSKPHTRLCLEALGRTQPSALVLWGLHSPFGQPGIELKGEALKLPLHFRGLSLLT